MGRWVYCGCVMGEVGKPIYTGREDEAKMREIMNQHNADCDAYEAKIAELEAALTAMTEAAEEMEYVCGLHNNRIHEQEAELARVKAESLRVSPDGDAVELDKIRRHQYVQWDGHVCVPDKLRCDIVRITDNHRYDVRQQYCDSFRLQPVRLERWEAEG